ncbi:exosome complex protein Rrp42 [Candidatus Micrarchaeota archaeon]|nr:exosome complex protein Rrp42 [Candidatus Micrarchaeota archaeon]
MILDEIREAYVKDLLTKGKRADGRGMLDYREIRIEKGIIANAEGSALASIGDTKVLAGIKFDIVEPFKDKPEEGTIVVNSEFSPVAHPEFSAGPPNEYSIELARVVDRGLRSAEVVDPKKLFIQEGKALGVFIDLYTLDNCGNLIDTAALAAMAALKCARVPKYDAEKQQLLREDFVGPLELARTVVTCSFEKIDGKTIIDASGEEEIASYGRVTIATCDGEMVCAAQKSGAAGFTADEIMGIIDVAIAKGNELRQKV